MRKQEQKIKELDAVYVRRLAREIDKAKCCKYAREVTCKKHTIMCIIKGNLVRRCLTDAGLPIHSFPN